jgi:hypothetical protein
VGALCTCTVCHLSCRRSWPTSPGGCDGSLSLSGPCVPSFRSRHALPPSPKTSCNRSGPWHPTNHHRLTPQKRIHSQTYLLLFHLLLGGKLRIVLGFLLSEHLKLAALVAVAVKTVVLFVFVFVVLFPETLKLCVKTSVLTTNLSPSCTTASFSWRLRGTCHRVPILRCGILTICVRLARGILSSCLLPPPCLSCGGL